MNFPLRSPSLALLVALLASPFPQASAQEARERRHPVLNAENALTTGLAVGAGGLLQYATSPPLHALERAIQVGEAGRQETLRNLAADEQADRIRSNEGAASARDRWAREAEASGDRKEARKMRRQAREYREEIEIIRATSPVSKERSREVWKRTFAASLAANEAVRRHETPAASRRRAGQIAVAGALGIWAAVRATKTYFEDRFAALDAGEPRATSSGH